MPAIRPITICCSFLIFPTSFRSRARRNSRKIIKLPPPPPLKMMLVMNFTERATMTKSKLFQRHSGPTQ